MVGWNVVMTQLVAGQVLFKISVLVYVILCNCISCIVNFLMECDEHVVVWNWCIAPLNNCNCKHLCMFSINEFRTKLKGRFGQNGNGLNDQIYPRMQ